MPEAPLSLRQYRIEFFQLSHVSTPEIPTMQDGFQAIVDEELETVVEFNSQVRDLWDCEIRQRPGSIMGQLRKFRMGDLPEVGRVGDRAEQLKLAENMGIVERNFFIYYHANQLLAWHANGHASSPNQFARAMGQILGTKVAADPVLQADAARRLMAANVQATKVILTVARPRNPDLYPEDDFGRDMIELMNRADADSMHLQLNIDTRRKDSEGRLKHEVKRALRSVFESMEVSTARAFVTEGAFTHPIDLIADRVISHQEVETDAHYPSNRTMYETIDRARAECEEAIHAYFGAVENAVG